MMFLVDSNDNAMNEIRSRTFSELHLKERENLQEWIAKNPSCLCTKENDRLLIIQKEFDGFDGTSERLDLLALDQDGSLVVIENKLDDTGRDVTWQILKYVSYCSTLQSQQIVDIFQKYLDKCSIGQNAGDSLEDFFNGQSIDEISLNSKDQRMILVAADFRPEVTSTVMWMLNHKLRVQCFRATPYKLNENVLLDIEQIIPVKEAEDYIIKIAEKDREKDEELASIKGIESVRQQFWRALLDQYNQIDTSYVNVNPSKDHWLSHGSGVSNCNFAFLATKTYVGVELDISSPNKENNKELYDKLFVDKQAIDASFGGTLLWERQDDNKRSRIAVVQNGVNVADQNDWNSMISFLCDVMPRFIKALKDPLNKAARR